MESPPFRYPPLKNTRSWNPKLTIRLFGPSRPRGPRTHFGRLLPLWAQRAPITPVAGPENPKTRCIVKGEAQKSPLFWRFSLGFGFSQERLVPRNSTDKPLSLFKSPIFPDPFFTQISGRNFLPELCGEVHPETPLQALCCTPCSTEHSFEGRKGAKKEEEGGCPVKGAKRKNEA